MVCTVFFLVDDFFEERFSRRREEHIVTCSIVFAFSSRASYAITDNNISRQDNGEKVIRPTEKLNILTSEYLVEIV